MYIYICTYKYTYMYVYMYEIVYLCMNNNKCCRFLTLSVCMYYMYVVWMYVYINHKINFAMRCWIFFDRFVCIHVYAYVYTHICMLIPCLKMLYTHCIYTNIHKHTHIYIYTHARNTHIRILTRTYTYFRLLRHKQTNTHIHKHENIYSHPTHTHTHTHTYIHT